jgi:hypothetical protein
MSAIRFTLLGDGASDERLIPVLSWLMIQYVPAYPVQPTCADLLRLPRVPKELTDRIQAALDLYPCDVLFVHRDAESQPRQARADEIFSAVRSLSPGSIPPHIAVVPVRMSEAWLLIDEAAIRCAAGNPNGSASLVMPRIRDLERIPDPKTLLHQLLNVASEFRGRRLKKFDARRASLRVAQFIEDYNPLRRLTAFRALEEDIEQLCVRMSW